MPLMSRKSPPCRSFPARCSIRDLLEKLEEMDAKIITLDALSMAVQAGNAKAVNVVMLGAVSKGMDYSLEEWEAALRSTVPAKLIDINLKAFHLGRQR